MHELPVTQSIVNICLEELEKNKGKAVKEINIVEGELSDMVPESIHMYFEILTKGTKLQDAVLNIAKIPAKIQCKDCSFEGTFNKTDFFCSKCGSENISIVGGREFYIDSMEVEDFGD